MAKKICTTKERLAEMMHVLDISAADIVRKTGINKSTLSNYINGKRTAVQDQLSLIADPYGIDPAWLMGYDVPMRPSTTKDDPDQLKKAIELYQTFENLPPDKQTEFVNFLKFLQSNS